MTAVAPDTDTVTDSERTLVLDRELAASAAQLWRCWSEPALLEQWFCPRPWRVSDARIDLRPGGKFFTVMNGPDGERFENAGVVLAVEPQRRLVTTDAFRPGWIPGERAFMTADIRFEERGEGKTRYCAQVRHWSIADREEHERMGFHEGWGLACDQLEALARTL